MRRVTTIGLSVICVALLGVATNVATGALPERWSPYLWLAWPLLVLLVLALVAVEVLQAREPRRATVAGAARARRVLLERVRRYWVTSVLDRSLYEEARIELGIAATTDDRRHPWSLRASNRDGFTVTLDDRASMSEVFERLDRAVVILGAPGAGKTTTLLELARDLLDRAEADPDAPIPVVLNLASWATHRRSLSRWLIEQLTERYGIPPEQGASWVDAGEILPLLDGLDEVAEEHRDACAEAIADFHARQPLTPIAVCCRRAEYERLRTELPVYGTVLIQPLTRKQIERYVDRPGLAGLRGALAADPELWRFADSPLLLSIMALAYVDGPDARPGDGRGGSGRERLFSRYVDAMLRQRPHRRYPPERTAAYLTSLAQELRRRKQTVFVLDLLDETWAPRFREIPTASMISRIVTTGILGLGLVAAGWSLVGPAGLTTAVGLVALTLILFVKRYRDLAHISYLMSGADDELGTYSWFIGSLLSLAVVLEELPTVLGIGGLAAVVGAASGQLAADDPSWTLGLGYGAGFFAAALVTFAVLDSAYVVLFLRPSALRADRRELPSPLLRQRLGFAVRGLVPIGTVTGCLAGSLVAWPGDASAGIRFGCLVGLGSMLVVLVLIALAPMVEQCLVRRRLARQQVLPYPLLPFLAHAVQCLFLRQVGDGYIFVHRELLDYFANRGREHVPPTADVLPAEGDVETTTPTA